MSEPEHDWDRLVANALEWATSRQGSSDYPHVCLGFVEDAYELANDFELDGYATAKGAADGYGAAKGDEPPPRGALVFYDCSGPIRGMDRNWGHVGLSLGEGTVIHAWDVVRTDDFMAVEELAAPGWTSPRYIGWVPVDVFVPHHPEVPEVDPFQT